MSLLLTPASSEARKRLPSQSSPDLASSIREELSLSLIQHKGDWQCYFLTQLTTFTLPAGMYVQSLYELCVCVYACLHCVYVCVVSVCVDVGGGAVVIEKGTDYNMLWLLHVESLQIFSSFAQLCRSDAWMRLLIEMWRKVC